MKHLPKHLRPRYRYIAVGIEAWPGATFDRRPFQEAIWSATRSLFGDVGSAAIDPTVMRFEFADGEGAAIVRVRHDEVRRGRATIACVDRIDGHEVGIHVRGVSGTIRACEETYMGGRREPISERTVACGNAERTAVVRGGRLDVRTDDAFAGATDFDFQN